MKRLCLVLVLVLWAGCSMQRKFTYPLDGPIARKNPNPPDVKVAVLPLQDERGSKNVSATFLLYLIPVMPCGWGTYERPEGKVLVSIGSFEMNAKEDIAKAIAKHWQAAGVAKTVFFDSGGLKDTTDYVLSTRLNRLEYKGVVISYGLSACGPLLSFFGLPAGHSRVNLDMSLDLQDKAGKSVWKKQISEEWGVTQGFYYNMGRDMMGAAICLRRGLDAANDASLQDAISKLKADKVSKTLAQLEAKRKHEEEVRLAAEATAAAQAEAKRKAEEETVVYDVDGLVLLVKTIQGSRGEYGGGEITGIVINRRSRALSYAQISFNLYDESGAQVGSALANINGLEPGGRWKFKAISFGTDFASYKFSQLLGY
jgi:hypothetical protein